VHQTDQRLDRSQEFLAYTNEIVARLLAHKTPSPPCPIDVHVWRLQCSTHMALPTVRDLKAKVEI
jgi:hypothetical protein